MATIAVVLNTTKKLTNNQYAIALRVTHERQSKYYAFSTLVGEFADIDHLIPAQTDHLFRAKLTT